MSDQTTRTGIGPRVWSGLSIAWSYDAHFFEKTAMSSDKNHNGKIFLEIEIFILEYVLDFSEPIPIKAIYDQSLLPLPFFRIMTPIFRKTAMSQEKSHNWNFFRNRDFYFKIRFGPFRIDFDLKKYFDQNLSEYSFLKICGQKNFPPNFCTLHLAHYIAVRLIHHAHVYL